MLSRESEPKPVRLIVEDGDISGTPLITFQLWRRIIVSLPDDYTLPNPESLRILLPMTAGYYSSLFTGPSAQVHFLVDDQIWQRIKASLPKTYRLPASDLE